MGSWGRGVKKPKIRCEKGERGLKNVEWYTFWMALYRVSWLRFSSFFSWSAPSILILVPTVLLLLDLEGSLLSSQVISFLLYHAPLKNRARARNSIFNTNVFPLFDFCWLLMPSAILFFQKWSHVIRLGAKKISNLFSKATTDFIRNQYFRRLHEMLLFGNKQFLKIFRMILTMCLLVLICKFKPNNLITGGCFYLLVEQARQFLLTYFFRLFMRGCNIVRGISCLK